MSNSFYGGRDGAPMVIKKKYETIAEMLNDFKKNINHPDLKFGDHVIIQSKNRNNPENGRIFRRSLDIGSGREIEHWTLNTETNIFTSTKIDAQGAVLVGQIVGPSGNAPHLHLLSTKADVDAQYTDFNNKPGYDVKIGDNDSEASTNELGLGNLVPGKDGENFNDKITWRYCSVRDENQQETDAYIGFEIPYTIIEFEADSVNAYYHRNNETNDFINEDLVDRLDDTTHPFYQKWQINIPKGIHGQSIKSIEVIPANSNLVKLTYNEDEEKTLARDENGKLITEPYTDATAINDDIQNARLVIVCNFMDYDRVPQGEPYAVYLGDYNMIDGIELADDGTFTIDYSHDDNYVKGIDTGENGKDERLTWITGASLDVETGSLDVETNNDTKEIHENLTWVKNLTIGDTGLLNTITTTGENQIKDQQLHWVKDIAIDDESGVVTYTDVDTNTTTDQLTWVRDIQFNENGTVTIKYTTNKADTTYNNLVDWIKSINIAQDGAVSVVSNNGTELLDSNQSKLKWVEGVALEQDGTFKQTYNNGETTPQQETKLKWATNIKVNDDGTIETEFNNGDPVVQGPTMDWIKSASFDSEKNLLIDYVNADDVNVNLKTVNDIVFKNGDIYAIYNTGAEEVYIGSIDNATVNMIAGDENIDTSNLRTGGLWFVTKEMEV